MVVGPVVRVHLRGHLAPGVMLRMHRTTLMVGELPIVRALTIRVFDMRHDFVVLVATKSAIVIVFHFRSPLSRLRMGYFSVCKAYYSGC